MIDSTPELDEEWAPTPHPENIPRGVVCVINTHRHFDQRGGCEYTRLDSRGVVEQRAECRSGEDEELGRAPGRHRGGARAAGHERDLAEEVAGAEPVHELAAALDVGDAVREDEELLASL